MLSAENENQLWVPPGFAYGFATLSETAEFLYKITDFYSHADERCIAWDYQEIVIEWPIDFSPSLSGKDQLGVALANAYVFG